MNKPLTKNQDGLQSDFHAGRTSRVALLSLLAGGGLLATARFLRLAGASEALSVIAAFAEALGWGSLVSSTVALLVEGRAGVQIRTKAKPDFGQRRKAPSSFKPTVSHQPDEISREDTIDRLYAELRPLMSRAATDPSLREEVAAKLSRLRELQSAEADEMQRRFEAGLLLKPGEGWKALDRARELLARYENSPSPNPTPEHHS